MERIDSRKFNETRPVKMTTGLFLLQTVPF